MNRLIIIGNGFDLAHGMKTSYKDFIHWYILDNLKLCETNGWEYEDEIMLVKRYHQNYNTNLSLQNLSKLYRLEKMEQFYSYNAPTDIDFVIFSKSHFMLELIRNLVDKNWVDIEKEYYRSLKLSYSNYPPGLKDDLVALNKGFQLLKEKLIAYLKTIKIPSLSPAYDKLFRSPLISTKMAIQSNPSRIFLNSSPNHTLFLDFNYTNTIKQYLDGYSWYSKASHIQIHGDLLNDKNPIIFGYGDEMDEEYKAIELKDNKEYLKFFKSFGYAYTSNQRRLTAFLESDQFEIYVIGHSCGLSDRVMLNAIFEHANCGDIQLHYYERKDGTNDFIELYQNVARNFDLLKRNEMRNKVISLEDSEPLPQMN